jgi:hypothetical protein
MSNDYRTRADLKTSAGQRSSGITRTESELAGRTGIFAEASGTVLSSGTLDERTGTFDASFSGPVTTSPEPAGFALAGGMDLAQFSTA